MGRILLTRTNDPVREQWRALLRFAYPAHIRRVFEEFERPAPATGLVESVAGACRQAHAYFTAAAAAPLDISPLLLYYGASNLLAAVFTLRRGEAPDVAHHGMTLDPPAANGRVGDAALCCTASARGALSAFAGLLSADPPPAGGERWTLREVVAGLPDVTMFPDWPYEPADRRTLPVTVVRREHEAVERLDRDACFGREPAECLRRVPGMERAYLRPYDRYLAVILHPRRGAHDIGTYSALGDKYLVMAREAGPRPAAPPHALSYFMALYILGMLSRYHPGVWHPFVRADTTGERAMVERLVDAATRVFPRLALESLYDARWQFEGGTAEPEDSRERVTPRDAERVARETWERVRAAGSTDVWDDQWEEAAVREDSATAVAPDELTGETPNG